MSEVNVRKWHNFVISSHCSSKIGHIKIKLETITLVLGYFYTACSASSVEETFTISEDNWIKKERITPQNACEKTNKKWKFKPHQTKGFIRRRNFHNIRRKLHEKRSVDCVRTLFNILIFACFYI